MINDKILNAYLIDLMFSIVLFSNYFLTLTI